ncbi:MAG: hypothetical protein KDE55_07740 [Novosphingobium sp.]|nr:hypothetical protein [Novosphingobium sp.]
MKPIIPVHRLRRQARLISRKQGLPLHAALDRIAAGEGFRNWSHMVAKFSSAGGGKYAVAGNAPQVYARLAPGELVLLGARPGEGKTLMGLGLVAEAVKAGHRGAFFTLEYTERDVLEQLKKIGFELASLSPAFQLDCSDMIHGEHVARALGRPPRGTLAIVDYLQLLDQRRENPPLNEQVRILKRFARENGATLVMLSQIDRSYDPSVKPFPDIADIRLPNPLNLTLFDKMCFLSHGEVRFREAA